MNKNKVLTLKLIDFSEAECDSFTCVLTLANRFLEAHWQLVDTTNADFYLLAAQSHRSEIYPAERYIFCSETPSTTGNYLLVDKRHIPGLRNLAELLNRLSRCEIPPTAIEIPKVVKEITKERGVFLANDTPIKTIPEPIIRDYFDPEIGLLGYLLRKTPAQFRLTLADTNLIPLFIESHKATFYYQYPLEQLDDYLTAKSESLILTDYSAIEFDYAVEHLKPRPLKELIWHIAIKTSQGKVIKGHQDAAFVTLNMWPDLRLSGCFDYAKLAMFMKNNATTLSIIASETQTPLPEVYNFYNACFLIGLIQQVSEAKLIPKTHDKERQTLLAKINTRLNQPF